MNVSRPNSLVQRTVMALRDAIAAGDIGPSLPGEPRLARKLGVARRTLRSALDVLTREGDISPAVRGQCRVVLSKKAGRPVRKTSRTVAVLLPRPLESISVGSQDFLRDLAVALAGEGVIFVYEHLSYSSPRRPVRRLKALLGERSADLWILVEASDAVASYFESSGVPSIVCGGSATNANQSSCAFDGGVTLRHAIGVLCRAGHERITAPMRYPFLKQVEVMQEEFERREISFVESYNAPFWSDEPDQLRRILRRQFAMPLRPTAIVLNGMDALAVLYSTLLEFRLSIPQDLSVIVSGSDPMLEHFRPALNHYTTPHRVLAKTIAKMIRDRLRDPSAPPVENRLLMDYVRGRSVGPPPSPR